MIEQSDNFKKIKLFKNSKKKNQSNSITYIIYKRYDNLKKYEIFVKFILNF